MNYTKGLVSVIIPTYRRSDKLGRAIKSVINQTYKNIEILVVSDNEPDDEYSYKVKKLVYSFCDNRLRIILQEHHKNGAAARNKGIREAKGEYIAFLDDDDYWEQEKLELQVQTISNLDNTWGAVTCKNKAYVNGKLKAALPPIKDGWICKDILTRMSDVSTDAVLIRHRALDSSGYFDEKLKRNQEVQLIACLSNKYKIKLLNMYLVNVDSSANENQPNPEKMENIKKQFLNSVQPILETFSKKDINEIIVMNKFEIGILYIRNRKFKSGFRLCCQIFKNPTTFSSAIKYIYNKISRRIFAVKRVQNDSYTKQYKGLKKLIGEADDDK